jgi:hypothetical protein
MAESLDRDEQAKLLQLAVEDYLRNFPDETEDDVLPRLEQALRDGDARVLLYTDRVVLVFQHEEFYSIEPEKLRLLAHAQMN